MVAAPAAACPSVPLSLCPSAQCDVILTACQGLRWPRWRGHVGTRTWLGGVTPKLGLLGVSPGWESSGSSCRGVASVQDLPGPPVKAALPRHGPPSLSFPSRFGGAGRGPRVPTPAPWPCAPGAPPAPRSRLAADLGHSCAQQQGFWRAARRARIPRGGICPRQRRLTFPALGTIPGPVLPSTAPRLGTPSPATPRLLGQLLLLAQRCGERWR